MILRSFVRILPLVFLLVGCREEIADELENYGIQREWLPFDVSVQDSNFVRDPIPNAEPWFAAQSVKRNYSVALDAHARSGAHALKVTSSDDRSGSVWISRSESVEDLIGYRVRFSAYVKAVDWSGSIAIGYNKEGMTRPVELDTFHALNDRWIRIGIDFDVASTDPYVGLWVKLKGEGTVYLDDCSLEKQAKIGPAPSNPVALSRVNFGFEDGESRFSESDPMNGDSLSFRISPWRKRYYVTDFRFGLDSMHAHTGTYSASITALRDHPGSTGDLYYIFTPEMLQSQRVKFTVWLRAMDMKGVVTLTSISRGHGKRNTPVERVWDLKDSDGWRAFSMELDVDESATFVGFGVGLAGSGTLLIDDLSCERVKVLPHSADFEDQSGFIAHPVNLGFEGR